MSKITNQCKKDFFDEAACSPVKTVTIYIDVYMLFRAFDLPYPPSSFLAGSQFPFEL